MFRESCGYFHVPPLHMSYVSHEDLLLAHPSLALRAAFICSDVYRRLITCCQTAELKAQQRFVLAEMIEPAHH